jgi:hypothetical protein
MAATETNAPITGSLPPPPPEDSERVKRAIETYSAARDRSNQSTNDAKAAWEFARACFDLAEVAPNSARRAELAQQGIKAAERSIALNSNSAPAHYYLGMNLGQLARTRGISALRLVGRIRNQFETARGLDPLFDNAGPDRNLGMIYRDAPAFWSVGDRKLARRHLLRSVELAETYPENRLALIEGLIKWGEFDEARQQFLKLDALWADGQKEFSGPEWASSWESWEATRKQLREQLNRKQR